MARLVTIIGGSGFVGRYVAQRMAQAGWRVRVACRNPSEAVFVRPYGVVGQVVPVAANIRDDASVAEVLSGADAVVNCVGVLVERGANSFHAVHAEGPARIARLAREAGAVRFVHISAIGADPESESGYARSKAEGERLVIEAFPEATILRPSIIFGPEDEFFNRFAGMARRLPVLPLVGAETRFQPVWVEDVAAAVEACLEGRAEPGVYELGGPEVATFRELMELLGRVIRRPRPVVGLPNWLARLLGWAGDLGQTLSFGLLPAPITRDQVRQLAHDNVVAESARGFSELGIRPTPMEAILPSYLWRFRPDGQYSDIAREQRRLRG